MSHTNTILNQLLKIIPRHEFEALANHTDGRVKATALSRWSQCVALTVGQLGQRSSLRDIENTLHSQRRVRYHLGSQSISKDGEDLSLYYQPF